MEVGVEEGVTMGGAEGGQKLVDLAPLGGGEAALSAAP